MMTTRWLGALCTLVLLSTLFTTPPAASQEADEAQVAQQLQEGVRLLADRYASMRTLRKACKHFEKARKVSEGNCPACELGLAVAYNRMGDYGNARRSALRVLEWSDDPNSLGLAHNELALGILLHTRKPGRHEIRRMEEELRKALEILPEDSPHQDGIRLNLAAALEWQGNLDEALALIQPPLDPALVERFAKSPPQETVGDMTPPVKIHTPTPQYNSIARARRIQGAVMLQCIITKEGSVVEVRVLRPVEGLTATAVEAIRRWRFKPATIDGKPVDVLYNLTVNFTIG